MEVESRLSDPSVISDVEKFTKLNREYASLEPIAKKIREYREILRKIDEDKSLLANSADEDLKILAEEEILELKVLFCLSIL